MGAFSSRFSPHPHNEGMEACPPHTSPAPYGVGFLLDRKRLEHLLAFQVFDHINNTITFGLCIGQKFLNTA